MDTEIAVSYLRIPQVFYQFFYRLDKKDIEVIIRHAILNLNESTSQKRNNDFFFENFI